MSWASVIKWSRRIGVILGFLNDVMSTETPVTDFPLEIVKHERVRGKDLRSKE